LRTIFLLAFLLTLILFIVLSEPIALPSSGGFFLIIISFSPFLLTMISIHEDIKHAKNERMKKKKCKQRKDPKKCKICGSTWMVDHQDFCEECKQRYGRIAGIP